MTTDNFEKYPLESLKILNQCALCQHVENNYPNSSICTCKVNTKDGGKVCPAFFLAPDRINTIIGKLEDYTKLDTLSEALKKSKII